MRRESARCLASHPPCPRFVLICIRISVDMRTPMDAWHPSQTFSPLHSLARQSSQELLWWMRSSLAAGGVGRRQEEDEQSPRRWWPLRGPWSVAATAAALQPLSASPSLSNTPPPALASLGGGASQYGRQRDQLPLRGAVRLHGRRKHVSCQQRRPTAALATVSAPTGAGEAEGAAPALRRVRWVAPRPWWLAGAV